MSQADNSPTTSVVDICKRDAQEARVIQLLRAMDEEKKRAIMAFVREQNAGAPVYDSALRLTMALGHDYERAREMAARWAAG
jgi:hypothetical protein